MKELQLSLLKWFEKNARKLPWREDRMPYRVLVSEVMLQQTRASVVEDYFARWMERFPDFHLLSKASLEEVVKQWEGLGYYKRAKMLWECAKWVVEKYEGDLPEDEKTLLTIPGIGPYTAAAIACFAYNKSAHPIDGNVERVITRLFGIVEDPKKKQIRNEIQSYLEKIGQGATPRLIGEAWIEFGALQCTPKPMCAQCPLAACCVAYKKDQVAFLPAKKKRPVTIKLSHTIYLWVCLEEVLVYRHGSKERFAMLCSFPKEGIAPFTVMHTLPQQKHHFTKFQATLHPEVMWIEQKFWVPEGYEWIPICRLGELSFCAGHRQVAQDLFENLPFLYTEFRKKSNL